MDATPGHQIASIRRIAHDARICSGSWLITTTLHTQLRLQVSLPKSPIAAIAMEHTHD